MEAFTPLNCLSLLLILYLIVTSDLLVGVHGSHRNTFFARLDHARSQSSSNRAERISSSRRNFLYASGSYRSSLSAASSTSASALALHENNPVPISPSSMSPTGADSVINYNRDNTADDSSNNDNGLLIPDNNNKMRPSSTPSPSKFGIARGADDDGSGKERGDAVGGRGRSDSNIINEDYAEAEKTGEQRDKPLRSVPSLPPPYSSSSIYQSFGEQKVTEVDPLPFPVAYRTYPVSHYDYQIESQNMVDDNNGAVSIVANSNNGNDDNPHVTITKGRRRKRSSIENENYNNNHNTNDNQEESRDKSVASSTNNINDSNNNGDEVSPDLPQAYAEDNEGKGTTSPMEEQLKEISSPASTLDANDHGSNDRNQTDGSSDEYLSTTEINPLAGTITLRGKCNETIQCFGEHVECRLGICKCQLGYLPRMDNGDLCGEASAYHVEVPTADPTMIGVVVGLALMSVTLCIVLRLFAKARFRENRTIFNTPNPRLMNVSLLKGSKTLLRGNSAGQRSRRGSQASVASGQIEGQSPVNATPDGNGTSAAAAGSSSHPHRVKPSRTLSTDTANLEGTQASTKPASSVNRSKFRQDSVASNV